MEESSNLSVLRFSSALKEKGIEGYDSYYTDEGFLFEYFKIPVPYLKEKDEDPDVHYIFVDVENSVEHGIEYKVSGNYSHEHCKNIDLAISIISGLISKRLVEVSLVIGDSSASTFMHNKGSDEKNVEFFVGKFDEIAKNLNNPTWNERQNGHLHTRFMADPPFSIIGVQSGAMTLEGVKMYAVSAEFGKHPEFYIMEQN